MKRLRSLLAIAVMALLPMPLVADTAAPEQEQLLRQAVANTRDWNRLDQGLALEYLQTVAIDDGEQARQQVRRVDERLPPDQRVTLVSVNGAPPDEAALGEFRKQRERDIKRAAKAKEDDRSVSIAFDEFDLSGARFKEQRGDRLVFAVPNAVRSMLGESNADMADHLQMEVEVDQAEAGPYLARLAVESTAPFKPGMIGKVERFQMQMDLALHDSGRLVMDRMDVEVRARAMFRDIESRQQIEFSGYQAHPAPAAASAD